MLHIRDEVGLVDNLLAEEGLKHVLERDDALDAAVLVHNEGDMLVPIEELIESIGDGSNLG
jgi:hypothetical protein